MVAISLALCNLKSVQSEIAAIRICDLGIQGQKNVRNPNDHSWCFSARGRGKGEPEAPGKGGGSFFIESPTRGVLLGGGGAGPGVGRVSAGNFRGGG